MLIAFVLGAVAVIVVNMFSRRLGIAAPLLLVLAGVAVSFLPFVPAVVVEPEWILGGVLPPLLYAAAIGLPTMDFRRDLKVIGSLSVVLVVVTAVLVGWLLSVVVPGINLPMGIALGAVISPTDAVATSIVRRLGVSGRIVTILEGESLLNDASALVVLRSAVAAMVASVSLGHVARDFVYAVVVAVIVGVVVGKVSLVVRGKIHDSALNTAASFVVPFLAYLPTEHFGASGLVAVVVTGLVMGHGAPHYLRAEDRRAEESNWRTVEVLLEGAVFLLMGLELSGLVAEVRAEHQSALVAVGIAAMLLAVVLALRGAYWVPLLLGVRRRGDRLRATRPLLTGVQKRLDADPPTAEERAAIAGALRPAQKRRWRRIARRGAKPGAYVPNPQQMEARRGRIQQFVDRRLADIDYVTSEPLDEKAGLVLVWAGMRGAVTLAAAQTLPASVPGNPGYHRALLVLVAFLVAAGSLLLQGGTLSWLVSRLGLGERDPRAIEVEQLQLVAELSAPAATLCDDPSLRRSTGDEFDPQVVASVRREAVRVVDNHGLGSDGPVLDRLDQYNELRRRVLQTQRDELLRLRDIGSYSSEALDGVLEVLDADEIGLDARGAGAAE